MTETTQPAKAEKTAPEKVTRYAAYDTTYLKFVGGVHATKAAATKAAKDAKVDKFEIREV